MTASDDFIPDMSELHAFLAVVVAPEICRLSTDLGVDNTFSAHAFACGEEHVVPGSTPSSWTVRAIFRAAHTAGRALVQIQARPVAPHPTGYSGFVLKGGYDIGRPSTFSARSMTNEYRTTGFRAWA
jgi:hypothetical protein